MWWSFSECLILLWCSMTHVSGSHSFRGTLNAGPLVCCHQYGYSAPSSFSKNLDAGKGPCTGGKCRRKKTHLELWRAVVYINSLPTHWLQHVLCNGKSHTSTKCYLNSRAIQKYTSNLHKHLETSVKNQNISRLLTSNPHMLHHVWGLQGHPTWPNDVQKQENGPRSATIYTGKVPLIYTKRTRGGARLNLAPAGLADK